MTKSLAAFALMGAVCGAAVSAGSSSAQLTVGVTVVRSCTVDVQPTEPSSPVHLTCTTGAQSTVRQSETPATAVSPVSSSSAQIVTLNF